VKKITARDVASTVQMKLGDTLEIALEGNPTTGYTWAVASKVAQLQQQGEWELKRDSNLIGAGGTIILRFKAVREGEATLQLIYHRVWEKGVPPVKTFEVKVVVGKGSTADAPGERSR
jgi:inhibitor of cysteine peptidase